MIYPSYLRSRIKRGLGCGRGSSYQPWCSVAAISSDGTAGDPGGLKTGRQHQLLSSPERLYFYLMERHVNVIDIREQFPILEISRSIELCAEVGLQHKLTAGYPEPYTIDFLITESVDGDEFVRAASIKAFDFELTHKDHAKLSVEYRWCEENGIPWQLVEWSEFRDPVAALSVLRFLRQWHVHGFLPDSYTQAKFVDHFMSVYEPNVLLRELLTKTASRLRLKFEQADDAFRHAAWHRKLPVTLDRELAYNLPLVFRMDSHAV